MTFFTSWRMKDRQIVFAPLIPNRAFVFDVGANYGEYTATFLGLGARCVVAIEPQGDLARFIATSFPDEVAQGRLILRTEAVGAREGVAKLYSGPDPHKSMATLSTVFVETSRGLDWDSEPRTEVRVITLDSLIEEYGTPDYIKIDVEGFDLEVLRGLHRDISLLSLEYNTQLRLIDIADECIKETPNKVDGGGG